MREPYSQYTGSCNSDNEITFVKFRLSEKHTKVEQIFLMVLINQLIYLVNVKTTRKILFKLYVLLKKSEL
jgi:hypothetical protein